MENLTARQILDLAKALKVGSSQPGYTDTKAQVSGEDLVTLIKAGGTFFPARGSGLGGGFTHEIAYEGHLFQTVTPYPAEHFERYTPK